MPGDGWEMWLDSVCADAMEALAFTALVARVQLLETGARKYLHEARR